MRSGNSGLPSNLSSSSLTSLRMMSETSRLLLSRFAPSNRSGSMRERNRRKSVPLPLCGVAVSSKKCRAMEPSSCPRWKRLVKFTLFPKAVADILWASSHTIKSQSEALSRSCRDSSRDSLSSLAMQKFISVKILPVTAASMRSLVSISKRRWNLWNSSSCHCSARLPGQTIMHRCTSPRMISSLMNRPVIMVLPAPGSSARTKRRGCLGSIFSYTAEIWCGRGWMEDVWTARYGSKRCASSMR